MSKTFTEVIFDTETKKFFDDTGTNNPADLGVSILSLYYRTLDEDLHEIKGEMMSFWEGDFPKMWPYFLEADRIIGFNSIKFDVPALKPYAPSSFAALPHFDILQKTYEIAGSRYSLDKFARETLGRTKIDEGSNAIIYWQSQDPVKLALLRKYCEEDVAITRDLYDYGVKNKKLKFIDFWNTKGEIIVDFGYPTDFVQSGKQTSLF